MRFRAPRPRAVPTRTARARAAISKRVVADGRLEKVVTLVEGYRNYLVYHVKGTKSQLHTRIRSRSSQWLQARADPPLPSRSLACFLSRL